MIYFGLNTYAFTTGRRVSQEYFFDDATRTSPIKTPHRKKITNDIQQLNKLRAVNNEKLKKNKYYSYTGKFKRLTSKPVYVYCHNIHTTFSGITYSLLQSVVSDSFTINNIPLCTLVKPEVDTSFLLPFFHCNGTIKKKCQLQTHLSAAEALSKKEAKNSAFRYHYNFYEKSFNWTENDWSIRLVGGLKLNGIEAEFVGLSTFECLTDEFDISGLQANFFPFHGSPDILLPTASVIVGTDSRSGKDGATGHSGDSVTNYENSATSNDEDEDNMEDIAVDDEVETHSDISILEMCHQRNALTACDTESWPEKLGQLIICLVTVGHMTYLNAIVQGKQHTIEVCVQGMLIDKITGIIPCEVYISDGSTCVNIEDETNEATSPDHLLAHLIHIQEPHYRKKDDDSDVEQDPLP